MPKVTGIFDFFENLDTASLSDIENWLNKPYPEIALENYTSNRLFYPQAIPISQEDNQIELALLRVALKGDPRFINFTSRKIIIPDSFVLRMPNIAQLVWVFIDAFLLNSPQRKNALGVWTVVVRSKELDTTVGSVVIPDLRKNGVMEVNIEGRKDKIKYGSLMVIPCLKTHCTMHFKFSQGQILEKSEGGVDINGGSLGVVIDGRGI